METSIQNDFFDKNFIELLLENWVFQLAVVAELLAKWCSRQSTTLPQSNVHAAVDQDLSSEDEEDDGTWCYCKSVKGGAMIGSDAKISIVILNGPHEMPED